MVLVISSTCKFQFLTKYRMNGGATSDHLYGRLEYFKGVTTTFTVPPALYFTVGAKGYSKTKLILT